jgi:DNA-binding winged helix-turn-helix (wHTH) protein/TolB-like protein
MSPRLRFGEFEADVRTGELWRNGERVRVQDLPFRLLAALLERPGELVTRAELGQRLWGGDTFVDFDAGLNTAVAKLREALGDSADSPTLLETVPKRGYRLLAAVTPVRVTEIAEPSASPPRLADTPVAPSRPAALTPFTRRVLIGAAAVVVAGALSTYWWAGRITTRVAVVLFDNETDRQDFDRLAQTLTDSVVLRLGAEPALAVVGNSAILRSDRPFRDLKDIRQEVNADFIVIGQLQVRPEGYRVLAHLIRASDEAHVWVRETPFTTGDEPALEREIVEAIALAVRTNGV